MLIKEFAKIGKMALREMTNKITIEKEYIDLPIVDQANVETSLEISEQDLTQRMRELEKQNAFKYKMAKLNRLFDLLHACVDRPEQRMGYEKLANAIIASVSNPVTRQDLYGLLERCMHGERVTVQQESNEIHRGGLKSVDYKRLPKYALLQLLFYHFLEMDEQGVITRICDKAVAKQLGCHVKTVKYNRTLLEKVGLIYTSMSGKWVNVWIRDYSNYHKEMGSGYQRISFDFFKELLTMDHVNAVRFAVRQHLKYDNDTPKRQYARKTEGPVYSKLSFNDAKVFLPKYTHYQAKVLEFAKSSKVFDVKVENSDVYFQMDESFYGKALYEIRKKEYMEGILVTLKSYNDPTILDAFDEKDKNDLVQLTFEYGRDIVSNALSNLIYDLFYDSDARPINNKGGYLRTFIRSDLLSSEPGQFALISA